MAKHCGAVYHDEVRIVSFIAMAVSLASTHADIRADYRSDMKLPTKIPYPPSNAYSKDKAELGKTLFFDTRLSASGSQACVSCHNPGRGWVDGLPRSQGHDAKLMARRSMPLFNLAWHDAFFWDGRADTLEKQILIAIKSGSALAMSEEELVKRVTSVPGYAPMFALAFPNEAVSADTITKALATYVRGIVTAPAPFDKWLAGDDHAISASAARGFTVFTGKGKCVACHSGWDFTDRGFHDTGLPDADVGRGKIQPQVSAFDHAFKTPSLRNLLGRGPYMHDGSITTIESVVDYYDRGPEQHRDSVAPEITELSLTSSEKADLVAFLHTLQANEKPTTMPTIPY